MNKWLGLLKLLGPAIIATVVPHGDLIAPLVVHGIEEAEKMKGATGSEKLERAKTLVGIGISGMNTAAGKELVNPVEVNTAINSGISTVVDVVNLVSKKG
jgi:hypothetical protein